MLTPLRVLIHQYGYSLCAQLQGAFHLEGARIPRLSYGERGVSLILDGTSFLILIRKAKSTCCCYATELSHYAYFFTHYSIPQFSYIPPRCPYYSLSAGTLALKRVCRTRKSAESALLFAQFCLSRGVMRFIFSLFLHIEDIRVSSPSLRKTVEGRKRLHTAIRPIIPRMMPVSGQPLLFQN